MPQQLSILSFMQASEANEPSSKNKECFVVDLFCGAGGFSAGAAMAGAKIIYACDVDEQALQVHKLNHPETQHVCQSLPAMNIPFPTDGRQWHLHSSPPCQKLSVANNTHRKEGDREDALALVEWCIYTALVSGCQTWSLEQVSSKLVIQLLDFYRKQHPNRVAYCVFEFSELGVPQTRRRIIAGTPWVVASLMRMRKTTKSVGIRDVIEKPRGDFIRDGSYTGKKRERRAFSAGPRGIVNMRANWRDHCRSVEKASYTVLANRGHTWVTFPQSGECVHTRLDTHEYAALQTFPPDYIFPRNRALCQRLIGNAIPCLVAKLIMQIVMNG
jgi:DNA (cytosine-5)-methyltransferase 1